MQLRARCPLVDRKRDVHQLVTSQLRDAPCARGFARSGQARPRE